MANSVVPFDNELDDWLKENIKTRYPNSEHSLTRLDLTSFMEMCNNEYFFPDDYWIVFIRQEIEIS